MQLSGLFITNENATLPLKKKYEYSGQLQKNKTSKVWVRKSTCPQNCLEMFSTIRTDLNTRSPVTENALNCNGVCLLRKGSRPEETGAGGPPRRCGFSKHTPQRMLPGEKQVPSFLRSTDHARNGQAASAQAAPVCQTSESGRPSPEWGPVVSLQQNGEKVAPTEFRDGRPSPETATL